LYPAVLLSLTGGIPECLVNKNKRKPAFVLLSSIVVYLEPTFHFFFFFFFFLLFILLLVILTRILCMLGFVTFFLLLSIILCIMTAVYVLFFFIIDFWPSTLLKDVSNAKKIKIKIKNKMEKILNK
jgi:hypothetical protein